MKASNMWCRTDQQLLVGNSDWLTASAPDTGSVRQSKDEKPWFVMRADDVIELGKFPTHAEAIEYAHKQATIHALAARFTIPPENPVARAMKETQ